MIFKRFFMISIAFVIFSLAVSCSVGGRSDAVASVEGNKIYRSDVHLLLMLDGGYSETDSSQILGKLIEEFQIVAETRKKYGDSEGNFKRLMDSQRERMLAQFYQRYFLEDNFGYSEDKLLKHFEAYRDSFSQEGKKSFFTVRSLVAKDLYIKEHQDSLNEFSKRYWEENGRPASVTVFAFETPDSSKIEEAIQKLQKNNDPSAAGFIQEKIVEKSEHRFLNFPEIRADFFGETPFPAGDSLKIYRLQDTFVALKILLRDQPVQLNIADKALQDMFFQQRQGEFSKQLMDSLKTYYEIQNEKMVSQGVREYYDSHLSEFMTSPGYVVYHIASKDSVKLAEKVKSIAFPDQFKALAVSKNEDLIVKAQDGLLGRIREDHVVPYGIGLMPKLFEFFKGKDAGTISPVLKGSDGEFHVFFMESKVEPEQKPFERVKASIEARLVNEQDVLLDSSFVLVTSRGKPFLTEGEILRTRAEIPEQERVRYPRERLRHMLTEWKVLAVAAKENGLEDHPMVRSFFRLSENSLYLKLFQDSLFSGIYTDAQLEESFRLNGARMFPGGTFEQVKKIMAHWMATPTLIMKHEYYFNQEVYESYLDYASAESRVFSSVRGKDFRNAYQRKFLTFKDKQRIEIFDKSFLPLPDNYTKEVLIAAADTAYASRDLDKAVKIWENLRGLYPLDEALFARSIFEIAKIESEKENFEKAEKEYRAFYLLFPENGNAEKVLFSRAFILRDALKKDSLSLSLFKEFKEKYPSSDLIESADWMIRDIESGGKLTQDLMEMIEKSDEQAP